MIRFERELYRPVGSLLGKLGYDTITDGFGVLPFEDGIRRRIDVLGYKWRQGRLHTIGVECKKTIPPDGIIEATGQAICYRLFTDECYVCTPAGKHLEAIPILEKLGIGYIDFNGRRAAIIRRPKSSKLPYDREGKHSEQVIPRLSSLLIFEGFASGYNIRKGGFRDGWGWVAMDIFQKEEIQQNLWADESEGWVFSGLNFEKKRPSVRAASNILKDHSKDFVRIVDGLPDGYRISVDDVGHIGKPEYKRLFQDSTDYSKGKAKRLLRRMLKIGGTKYRRPELSIHRRIWRIDESVSRRDGSRRLKDVLREIGPVAEFLKSMT